MGAHNMKPADANAILLNGGAEAVRAMSDQAETIKPRGRKPNAGANGRGPRFALTAFTQINSASTAEYLVKDMVPMSGLVLTYGAPKCGKSFWTFDLAMHVARGVNYRAKRVRGGPVVYLAAEGGHGFTKRVEAYRREHDCDHADFYLCIVRPDLAADAPAIIADVRTQLGDKTPVMIVVDTVNRTLVGSENKPDDMARYLRAAATLQDAFNCCVVLVHHCGVEQGRPRGHTSLTAAADVQIAIERDVADNIVATVELMKDGLSGEQIVSKLKPVVVGTDPDGDEITSCVIEPVNDAPVKKTRQWSTQIELARRALAHVIAEQGEQNPIIPAGLRGVPVGDWRHECYRRGIGGEEKDAKRKAFGRAKEKLAVCGVIGERDDIVWIAKIN